LLAEDNLVNQKVAVKVLERLGYDTYVVNSGLAAVEALQQSRYDVVLMDVQMPGMDGLEATRRVRAADSDAIDSSVPIVALTAHATAGDRQECLSSGMDDYLAKPIKPAELAETLERWVRRPQVKPQEDGPAPGPDSTEKARRTYVSAEETIFDPSVLLELLDGDSGAADQILSDFLDHAPQLINELEEAVARGDAPKVRLHAHTLKGASASVGAQSLRALSARLEEAAAAGSLEEAPDLVDDLGQALRLLEGVTATRGAVL